MNRPFAFPPAILLVTAFAALTVSVTGQDKPPAAPVKPVVDEYFGQKITDPYRWLEDQKSEEASTWMKAQADYTRAYLDRLPLRDDLAQHLTELNTAGVRVSGIQRRGDRYFYYKISPGENDRKLYVRDGLSSAERLLVDPDKASHGGKRYSIAGFAPSHDGTLLSYMLSAGGGEFGDVRIMDVATGADLPDVVERTRWFGGTWTPDGRSILYLKFQEPGAKVSPTELYQRLRVFRHVLGTQPVEDRPVFGSGVHPDIDVQPRLIPWVVIPNRSRLAYALLNTGVSPNSALYVAPVDTLSDATIPWRKIVDFEDQVSFGEVRGDDLYLLTYKNAPRFKVVRTSVAKPDLANASAVFPAGEAVVNNFTLARDAMYVETLDAGVPRVWRVPYDGTAEPLTLPFDGAVNITHGDLASDGILYSIYWWTRAPAVYAFEPQSGRSTDTRLVPPIPIDMSDVDAYFVTFKSHDGTTVPMAILHRKGLERNGTNPTLLTGYGAYGINSVEPRFFPMARAWLDRGGVFAIAGVRGGGEFGEEWHQAGFQDTKPNTWKDFIAAAEYLVAEKYTTPAYLAVRGGSAGGILISNAIAERPDLFRAANSAVGLNNVLRAETTPNGVPNIAEFGTFKTERGFKALLAMDGYHKVKDGVRYPAVILTHGINDPRVEPWMSAKFAARLQAATASTFPVLLRIDYDAGHGIGSSRSQDIAEQADVMAFFLAQMGEKARDSLQPSVPVTRDISGSDTHAYRVPLRAGQALHVVAQQLGVDVVVTVFAPDGAPLVEMDSPNGANGPESVWIVAAADGEHAIQVRPLIAASTGRYELRVEALRDATADDRARVELQDALLAAQRLSARPDANADARLGALDHFKRAAAAARHLKDDAALSVVSMNLLHLDPEGALQSSGLPSAPGDTPAYYSRGFEQRALHVRGRLTAPMTFFESKLQVRPKLAVAVLTRDDWTALTSFPPYGMPFAIPPSLLANPSARALLCMPETLDPEGGDAAAVARASQAAGIPAERGMRLADEFIVYHELAHIYADAYGITSWNTVVREFMATFLEVAYHGQLSFDERDRLFYETWMTPATWAGGQPPKNTSLDDFERLLIGVDNLGWYMAQLWKQAEAVYKAHGLAFVEGVKVAFPHGTPRLTLAETLARLEKISPGFIAWAEGLSRPPISP
jgi:prolyl oligopeptidase